MKEEIEHKLQVVMIMSGVLVAILLAILWIDYETDKTRKCIADCSSHGMKEETCDTMCSYRRY